MKKLFWNGVSVFGTLGAGLAFVVLAFALSIRFGLLAFINLAIITAAANIFKGFHFKPRPDNPEAYRPPNPITWSTCYRLADPRVAWRYFEFVDASSFPSIHSARSFNQALLFSIYVANPYLTPLFFLAAALIGLSRIVKRRHFLSDVTAGAILGLLTGTLTILLY